MKLKQVMDEKKKNVKQMVKDYKTAIMTKNKKEALKLKDAIQKEIKDKKLDPKKVWFGK